MTRPPIEMSMEELLALPVTFDLMRAGQAFGLGRTISYELAQAGNFPCTVRKLGERYKVTKADLFLALGIDLELPAEQQGAA